MKTAVKKNVVLFLLAVLATPGLARIADPSKGMSRVLVMETERSEQIPYQELGRNLKCPKGATDGRMFKNTMTESVEECYDRCYGLESCNFFTYLASSKMCIGCALDDESQLVHHDGFDGYRMIAMKSASEFGYELWNGVEGIGMKCPYQHEDRIRKIESTTKGECYQLCKENEECWWFSWGEDEVTNSKWKGNCMLCREDDEVQAHEGFNFWRLLRDDTLAETPDPTDSPSVVPSISPIQTSCPGDIELVAHDGVTLCETVSIESQSTTHVTVTVTQTCTPPGSESYIDYLFWKYHYSVFSDKCLGDAEVDGEESKTFTISCSATTQEALLEVWVVDDSSKGVLSESDDATVPRCCHSDIPEGITAYRAVYAISCVSAC